ncbi:MAG: hypothetical protein Q9173_001566 [Seirophora scorigena]
MDLQRLLLNVIHFYESEEPTATTIDIIDLSQRWNIADNKIWNRIEKNTSVSKPGPPSLNNGAIFANATSLWLYGGGVSLAPKRLPPTPPNGIWRYDIAAGEWTQPFASGDPVRRQSLGMSTNLGNSKAIYLGGARTAVLTASGDWDPAYLTQGLLVFDGYQESFSNVSTTGLNLYGTVASGFLSFIESVGDQGGVKPLVDRAVPYGSRGCDNNPRFSQGLGIFSLNNHEWRTDYDPIVGAAPYQVHSSISNVIGGNATGGATKTIPGHGFSSNSLRDLFERQGQSSSPLTPTDSASISEPTSGSRASHSLNTGAVAGISVGLASFLAITLGVLWVLRNRLRRHRQHYPRNSQPDEQTLPPLSQPSGPTEMYAGPAAGELRGGHAADSLTWMYRSYEVSNTTEKYEMPHTLESHARPSRFNIHEMSASSAIAELPGHGQTRTQSQA